MKVIHKTVNAYVGYVDVDVEVMVDDVFREFFPENLNELVDLLYEMADPSAHYGSIGQRANHWFWQLRGVVDRPSHNVHRLYEKRGAA